MFPIFWFYGIWQVHSIGEVSNSTRILIDGMNLIYKFPDLASFLVDSRLEDARVGLLTHLLQYYKDKKAMEVLVFFDGKKVSDPDCYSEIFETISVHYSHAKKADDLIIGYLTLTPVPSQCLVITSDKEIVSFARRVRAKRKSSEDFYKDWIAYFDAKDDAEQIQIKEGLTEMPDQEYWAKQFLT
jgi:predicted RNA-binding protein with PIN domain